MTRKTVARLKASVALVAIVAVLAMTTPVVAATLTPNEIQAAFFTGQPFTASTLTDPEEKRQAHETTSDLLLVYAPGSSPDQWPDGMAKFVPAGSDLVFQMHYTTNGTADKDQTEIGLVFAKTPPKQRVITLQVQKQPGTNVIQVTDAVRTVLPSLQAQLPPSVHLSIRQDRSRTIRQAFSDIQITMLITLARQEVAPAS